MKRISIIATILTIIFMMSFAEVPTNFSANYIGEKMWNTKQMVPYCGSVSLDIIDSMAYLKHSGNIAERVDTFVYKNIHNNCFRYIRKKHKYFYEYLLLSKDSLHLQVGEPMELNYFYKLESINRIVVCPQCRGKGEILCGRCYGTGSVLPKKNGGPDEAVGICPVCHGKESLKHLRCRRCKGTGMVKIKM